MLALLLLVLPLWALPGFFDQVGPPAPDTGVEVVAMDDGGPIPPKP
jgi:hypothetical protein